MTDEERDLLKTGAEAAFKPFGNLVERLFGGAVDQIGGAWEDHLKIRREIRRLKLFKKLQAAIDSAGFQPRPISDNIWIPAIQEALLQDDETLQEKWANLLANASDPRGEDQTSPLFVGILKELSSKEVRFLDRLFETIQSAKAHAMEARGQFSYRAILGIYQGANGLPPQERGDFDFSLQLIERNQIIVADSTPQPIKLADALARVPRGNMPSELPITTTQIYWVTPIGKRFIASCRAPRRDP